jgi:hypothetical protein
MKMKMKTEKQSITTFRQENKSALKLHKLKIHSSYKTTHI